MNQPCKELGREFLAEKTEGAKVVLVVGKDSEWKRGEGRQSVVSE